MAAWADVAVITKARTNDRGFVVRRTAGLLYSLEPGDAVDFVPPALDIPRHAIVTGTQPIDEKTYCVRFDIDAAAYGRDMVGMHCLVSRDGRDIGELHDLTYAGYAVESAEFGHIGQVVELDAESPQPKLIVQPASEAGERAVGDSAEIVIPFVDAFIVAIDDDAQRIDVDIPRGLLDL